MPVTNGGKKIVQVLCIYYPVKFQEVQGQIKALFNSGREVNTMSPAFAR